MARQWFLAAASALAIIALAPCVHAAPAAAEKPAGEVAGAPAKPDFRPGQEVKVEDTSLGQVGYYQVYLPPEYTPDRAWPAIFCYHGMGGSPTTWPFRQLLDGKGFVIIGMCYAGGNGGDAFRVTDQDTENARRLVAKLTEQLKLDRRQLFIGGFSMGGWITSIIGENAPTLWAAMAICGAGRNGAGRNPEAWRGRPVYIGVGEKDENHSAGEKANTFYRGKGARVTFETYPGKGHEVDTASKVFRDWLWDNGPLKQAKEDMDKARAAQTAGRLGQAYTLYKQAASVPGEHELCAEAAKAAEALAKDAEAALAAAKASAEKKEYAPATAAYGRLAATYRGCDFGQQAAKELAALKADPAVVGALEQSGINTSAKALEDQARAHEDAKDYAKAIELYEQYVARFEKADRFAEVKARLEALKSDKAIQATIRNTAADRDCRNWLGMADNFLKAGMKDRAREYLRKILDQYPDTEWGKQAKERMKKVE